METKLKHWILIGLLGAVFFGLAFWSWLKPPTEYSYAERRHLEQAPTLSVESIFSENSFMKQFEAYTTDQFPLRESFRGLNARFNRYLLGQQAVNDLYFEEGYAAALDYPLNEESLNWALDSFRNIQERWLENSKAYLAIVPDKGYFLAEANGYPAMDYDALIATMKNGTKDFAAYVDLTEYLSVEDYYKTDSHWKQENLTNVADAILLAMDAEKGEPYEQVLAADTFKGVYAGQSAMPVEAEPLYYLTNEVLEGLRISCLDSGNAVAMPLYDLEKAVGKDGYEMYLGGALALITIENPTVEEQRELVVLRDSFGSSLVPLLCGSYSKVTVVDTRYLSPAFLGNWINFDGADVLFLYSTSVLNNSIGQLLP